MPPTPISLIYARIARAHELTDLLEFEFEAWKAENPEPFVVEEGSDQMSLKVVAHINEEPFERWAMIYSDVVHQLRSALDNIVYHAWEHHSGLPTDEKALRKIGFPLYIDPVEYQNSVSGLIGGVPPATDTFIEGEQPYHRRYAPDVDALRVLHMMNNMDKHRAPRVVAVSLDSMTITIGGESQIFPTGEARSSLHDGTEVGVFTFNKPIPLGVEVQVEPTVAISIEYIVDASGLRQQIALIDSLRKIANRVERIVGQIVGHL